MKRASFILTALPLLLLPTAIQAQTSGRILGRVVDGESGEPVPTAEIRIEGTDLGTLTSEQGDFILRNVPPGEHRLRAERLGFTPTIVMVRVRAARTTQVRIELTRAPVGVPGVEVEVERVRLIEPDVVESHEAVLGGQLIELPVDEVEDAVELTTGVSDGRFRGGRVGQETYEIDGLNVKNQLSASTQGPVLELAPSSLAEIDVVTGGFGAKNGSALSGVVRYATRRGNRERWEGRAQVTTDHWAPDDLFRGFAGLSLSAGGPLRFLGDGTTLYADFLAQGMVDAEPRARGLTCLQPEDGDAALAARIDGLVSDPLTAPLYCPYTADRLPNQRGDKLIGFLRFDRPLSSQLDLSLSLLYNRRQNELYTREFKYNDDYQLGLRKQGAFLNLNLDWSKYSGGKVYRATFRGAALHLSQFVGAVDPATFEGRTQLAGFGLSEFQFLGEGFVKRPIEEQLERGTAVPGYQRPGGTTGSPFGPAAEGIFFTEGTPEFVTWGESGFLGADLDGELITTRGLSLRGGSSVRLYRIENYERVLAYLPGSSPNYALFYPSTASGYAEMSLAAAHDITVNLGLRVEGFESGLSFQRDRGNILAPRIDSEWKVNVLPRIGLAGPIPGTDGRSVIRFNYGLVAQPPDFQFFLDTSVGDSLRTVIRRQGNPDLSFERGAAWEAGVTHLANDHISLSATAFLKELTNLVTGVLVFTGFGENQFTTGDFGSVKGVELTVRARWPGLLVRGGYALQEAQGVTSGAFADPVAGTRQERIEFPLAFDRRHTADLSVFAGHAAGDPAQPWGGSLTATVASGFPLIRQDVQLTPDEGIDERLPWTYRVNLRVSRELGRLPGCGGCRWRVSADVRNLLGRDNVLALRGDTGTLAPSVSDLDAAAAEIPEDIRPIPRESPDYSRIADLDNDGLITAFELRTARFAAALDRNDPSLFFGGAREFRVGLEVVF